MTGQIVTGEFLYSRIEGSPFAHRESLENYARELTEHYGEVEFNDWCREIGRNPAPFPMISVNTLLSVDHMIFSIALSGVVEYMDGQTMNDEPEEVDEMRFDEEAYIHDKNIRWFNILNNKRTK